MCSSALRQLAIRSRRTDDELLAICAGWIPAENQLDVDLALALWHERQGWHDRGCDLCDLDILEPYAGAILNRPAPTAAAAGSALQPERRP